jgi:DNA-nicking Smr family endonuclease
VKLVAGKKKDKGGTSPFDALKALRDELAKNAQGPAGSPRKPSAARAPQAKETPRDPDDEALLLHRMYAGVTPLGGARARVPKQALDKASGPSSAARLAQRAADAADADAAAVHARLRELVEGRERFEVADDGRRVEGRRVDLPMDAVRRLRRGSLPIDARLDLHGMGVREARGQLELFLRTMRSRGERCVLVIHGKGEHSPDGRGILRGEIAAWLSQGASSEHVAAFATASEPDGGEGAVYVLLRRGLG